MGALTVNGGTLALNSGTTLNFGATAPGVNSLLNVTGALNLAGSSIAINLLQAGTNSVLQHRRHIHDRDLRQPYRRLRRAICSLSQLWTSSKAYSYATSGGSLTLSITDAGPVWTGNASPNWSNSGNWSTSAAPVNGQDLLFAGNNTANTNNIGGLQAAGLQFNAGAASFNLNGGAIQLSSRLVQPERC